MATQDYPCSGTLPSPAANSEHQAQNVEDDLWATEQTPAVDPWGPPLDEYSSNDEVWISIDIECHCQNQTFAEHKAGVHKTTRRICEIGLSTLDTRHVVGVEPGDRGLNFHKYLDFTEIAFTDVKHNKNKCRLSYCKVGDADDFLHGKTTWMHSTKAKDYLLRKIEMLLAGGRLNQAVSDGVSTEGRSRLRKAIFLVFDGANDIKWLKEAGIDLLAEFPNSEYLNIQGMGVARLIGTGICKRHGKCSADEVTIGLGIPCSGCHNGGNDAAAQMQAFIASLFLSSEHFQQLNKGHMLYPWLPPLWESEGVIARKEHNHKASTKEERTVLAPLTPSINNEADFPGLSQSMTKPGSVGVLNDVTAGTKLRSGENMETINAKEVGGKKGQKRRRNRVKIALDHSAFQ